MWNKVQLGFDAEDETVNFGARQMAVFEKSVYETSTVAIISRDEKNDGPREAPRIHCTKYYGPDPGIVIIVDETVTILRLEACGLKSTFSFDTLIDSYVVKSDGSLLVVALKNGDVFCFLLHTSENPIFLKNVCNPNTENTNTFIRIFLHDVGDSCELILTAYSGNIYTLKGISIAQLSKACLNDSKDSVNDVIENTKLDYISTSDVEHEFCNILHSLELGDGDDRRMLLLVQTRTGQELQLWSADFKEVCTLKIQLDSENCQLQKLFVPKDESLIYGLTDKGTILSICPYTLTTLHHQDSVKWNDCENLLGEDDSFLVLAMDSSAALQIVKMPEFCLKFQMEVNNEAHLAENQSLDDLIYLESVASQNNVQEISSIHVKMISESQPEYRLERILRRGKFNEAEDFARRFNLSVETVYKAHLQKLSNDIQPWATSNISIEETGRLFKELLRKVEDTEFVARCCLNAISTDFHLMMDVLKYAKDRIKTSLLNRENRGSTQLQQLYKEIGLILVKLNTFFIISEKSFSVDDWLTFSKANLIEVCQQFSRQGKLKELMLIWNRHIPTIRHQLSVDQATSFFRNLPNSLPLSSILEWLGTFLPTVFPIYPKIIANVINWCKEKVNIMELLAETNWIDNSIKFLKDILVIIEEDTKVCGMLNTVEFEYSVHSPVKDLLHSIKILTEMSIMKRDHEINITIREYTQENRQEVIFSVLDKVPVEELDAFLRGFFKTLLVQGNLNADAIISEYVLNLVETSVNWWYWEEAPWENRVDILIKYILGVQEKLNTVLTVLKYSPVPWSSTITRMCDESLKHDNPTSRLIFEQKRMISCKLILKKYDLKDITQIQPHFRKVVLNIFLQKRSTMLEDALQIAETFDSKLCVEVYKLYLQQIIENENIETAIAFLDDTKLPPSIVISCCESIILRTHGLSNVPVLASKLENYMQILDTAYSKLTQMTTKTNSLSVISKSVYTMCKQLKDIYYIKSNYTKDVRNNHFTNPTEKEELLKFCLNALLKNVEDDQTRFVTLGRKLKELANCFECSWGEVGLQFTQLSVAKNQFDVVVFMLRLLLNEEKFPAVVAKRITDFGFTMLAHFIRAGNVPEDSVPALMHHLTIIALDSCPLRSLQKGMEVGRWFQLMKNSPQLENSNTLTDREILHACAGSISPAKVVKLLTAYCLHLHAADMNSFDYYLDEESLNHIQNKHEFQIVETMQRIVEEENENIAFRSVMMMHWLGLHSDVFTERELGVDELVIQTKILANTCMDKFLKKLIVSRNLNSQFGSALLYHFPQEVACKWMSDSIRRYKFDFQRLCALTELGLVYFQCIQNEDMWKACYALRKRCTWGKQIAEYGISYKEAFRESSEEQRLLLQKLMSVPSISTTLLAKYCRDMNFSFQDCLKAYLKQTLLAWQPEYEVKISAMTGEKEIIIKNTHQHLLQKCREIISLIENRQELSDLINRSIWDAVNYYYYEVYLVILTLMEENVPQAAIGMFSNYRHVFLFLSTYQRITKPHEFEKEHWYQLHQSSHQSLPPISEHRLPFKLIYSKSSSDRWKIITPELTIRTYSKWFTVLDALELDKNRLCTLAIRQMTSERTLTEHPDVKWCIHPRHQKLLLDIRTCIEHIDSLEMASVSLYFVANHLPPGADQVTAAKLCYSQAKKWLETEKSAEAVNGFQKCYGKYLTISTTHILYVHELGKPQYLQLTLKEPTELINALYNDPIILERHSGNVLIFPDINKAAEEISKLHKINLHKIKMDLLEEWLLPENFLVNVSFGESPGRLKDDNSLHDKFSTADRENFLKACYIVEGDVQRLGSYLVQIAFDCNADESKPINVRLRALRCLFSVASEDVLEQITGKVIDKLRDHMKRLEFVSELETLGLTYTFASFTSCNKSEIIRTALTLKSKIAVRLATRMSRYFDIQSNAVWSDILTKMCSLEMIKDLMDVLPQLANIYHTLDIKILERSWNTVLITSLEKTPSNPSEDQLKLAKKAVELIQSCPIIDEINLDTIKENCARIGLLDLITNVDALKF